jgi:hypothetical protein
VGPKKLHWKQSLHQVMSIHRPWVYIGTHLHLFEWEISILNLHKYWKPEPVLQFTMLTKCQITKYTEILSYACRVKLLLVICTTGVTHQVHGWDRQDSTLQVCRVFRNTLNLAHIDILQQKHTKPSTLFQCSFFLACNKVSFVKGEEPTCKQMQISTSSYNMLETYSLDCKPLSFFLTLSEWSFHQEILIHLKTYSGEIFTKRFNLFLNMLMSW